MTTAVREAPAQYVTDRSDPDRLQWDEIVERGRAAREASDGAQWLLGDLASSVETRYGEHDLQKYADQIGINLDTLMDYRTTAKRFSVRYRQLPFSLLRQIGRLPAEQWDAWVACAEREHWTVARARREVAAALTEPIATPEREGKKKNLGMKAHADPIVTRFTTIANAFTSLAEMEEQENAEPEEIARKVQGDRERQRAVESAVERAQQFVDRWSRILNYEVSAAEDWGA